jgi:hypothetical protein
VLVGVFGPPCPMSVWGANLVRAVVESATGKAELIAASSVDELRKVWKSSEITSILYADWPEAPIVDVFLRGRAPIFVFLENEHEIVGYCMRERNCSALAAVRRVTQSMSTLHDLFARSNVFVIHRPGGQERCSEIVKYVREIMSLPGAVLLTGYDSSVNEALRRSITFVEEIKFFRRSAPQNELDLVSWAVSPLFTAINGMPADNIEWPGYVFLQADKPDTPLNGPIDLTGRARHIIYGPYLHLPRGRWMATAEFIVRGNYSGNELLADIAIGQEVTAAVAPLPERGAFTFDIGFEVTEPRNPIEIRLAIKRGAIEGSLELLRVVLKRA